MRKSTIILSAVALLLAITTAIGFAGWFRADKNTKHLESQLDVLQREEKRSMVLRSVSSQLEQIASEQQKISDEERERALEQTRVANELRRQSEIERQNAIEAERIAVASEQRALDAYDIAEQQRQLADHQRIQAEFSKRVTDTLSYISLARSLASLSITQYETGNQNLAAMLSYAAYLYTIRYGGDPYYTSIYQSLSLSSQSRSEWRSCLGAVTNLSFFPNSNNRLVAVSNYGEIVEFEQKGDKRTSKTIFFDNKCDFRDVLVNIRNKKVYAVSRTGHLVVMDDNGYELKELTNITHPMRLLPQEDKIYIIGEDGVQLFDITKNKVTVSRNVPYHITFACLRNARPLLFDDNHGVHDVRSMDLITSTTVPVIGTVTAYAKSSHGNYEVYGTDDGTIFFIKNNEIQRLIGHRSRISSIKVNNNFIYSASYDGTVNLWFADRINLKPTTLFSCSNWIMHLTLDNTKNHMFIGNQKGMTDAVLVSIPVMVDRIKEKLKRNFTTEEWNYYIGPQIPYEPIVPRKEDSQ